MAGRSAADIDLIAQNEQRLLASPEIIGAMFNNPHARMSTVDRAVELAADGITLDGAGHRILLESEATAIYASGPEGLEPRIEDALGLLAPITQVTSRADVTAQITAFPLINWTQRGMLVVSGLAIVVAAAAAATWVGLAAARNRRELGIVATLGLTRRQAARLVVAEHLPLAAIAVAVGALAGIGATQLLQRSLNVQAFTGHEETVDIAVSAQPVVVAAVAVAAALALAITTFVVTQRDATVRAMLKIGDET